MYYVYIIKSECGRFYVGSSDNVEKRLKQHNSKKFLCWTNRYNEWKVVYTECFKKRNEAIKRENQIKTMKGGNEFKKLIVPNNFV
ncbi:hypothetical protein AMJ80_05650 [bacterium SM23_31]|nr:MAG: hypothetical protein AMJ80_05650 [bacterium SM23_31]